MSTLSAVCASRSLEHLSETLVPAYASSCQEQLSETPAPASGPVSSPTASLRGGASKGTPLPRGKASEPGSEPDASSEYMSEATTTEDEAPRTPTTQPPAGLDFKAGLDFDAFSGLEALSAAISATFKGETSAIAPAPISLAAAIPESPSAWRAKWIQSGHRRCLVCGTAESPKWRCSMTLCNACGLRKAKQVRQCSPAVGLHYTCRPALRPSAHSGTLPAGPRRSRRPVRKGRGSLTIVEKCARCTGAPCRHAALPAGRPRQLDFSHGPHAACNSPLLNRYPHPARRHATRLHAIGELYGL